MGHNAKNLSQSNKKHKGVSKRQLKNGKNNTAISHKVIKDSKDLRLLKKNQKQAHSKNLLKECLYNKKGTNESAPLLCGVFSLSSATSYRDFITIISTCDTDGQSYETLKIDGYTTLNHESVIFKTKKFRKKLSFVNAGDYKNEFGYLDLLKVVDWAIFILPADLDELLSDYMHQLIKSMINQGFPASVFISPMCTKDHIRCINDIFHFDVSNSIFSFSEYNDTGKLVRYLCEACKPSFAVSKKDNSNSRDLQFKRGYFLGQSYNYNEESSELSISGCMRGYGMNKEISKWVHITGVGDFRIKSVKWVRHRDYNRFMDRGYVGDEPEVVSVDINHDQVEELSQEADNDEYDDAQMESEADEEEDEEEEEEEVYDIDDASDSDEKHDRASFASTAVSGYSIAQVQKFREAREELECPDEIYLERNESGREKFSKYRAIRNFRNSIWSTNIGLPNGYDKMRDFYNFFHVRNQLFNRIKKLDTQNADDSFISPGSQCVFVLDGFNQSSLQTLCKLKFVVVFSLLPEEQNIGVLHMNQRRLTEVDERNVELVANMAPGNGDEIRFGEEATALMENQNIGEITPLSEPIRSDEQMLFQVGFRRFISSPIYSNLDHSNVNCTGSRGKTRYSLFMEAGKNVLATCTGPVIYSGNVLQYRIRQKEDDYEEIGEPYVAELVATGTLNNIDSTRPLIERKFIAGDLYRVKGRSAIVRFMFHNNEDVDYFKAAPIFTRSGIQGRIRESRGEKGYMKCMFRKSVQQNEVILMPLFKRVFPSLEVVDKMYEIYGREGEAEDEESRMDI